MKLPKIDIDPEKIGNLKEARGVIQELLNVIEQLMEQNHQLSNKVEELEREVARLKKQSRKPNFKNKPQNKRYSSDKQRSEGKQPHQKTAKQVSIDREEDLPEVVECECGNREFDLMRTWNKLVQGLIIKRDNVLYRGKDKRCRQCGRVHRSQLPKGVKGYQFSPELRSTLSLLKYQCRMSEILISQFLYGLGVQISKGHINQIIMENSSQLIGGYTHLKVWGLKVSHYLHCDATGFTQRVINTGNKLRHHLHFVGHRYLSLFKITSRYNSTSLADKVLGKRGRQAIYISDDASANGQRLPITHKQICWIHEIRHYLKLEPKVKGHQKQLEQVVDRWWCWYQQAKQYRRDPTEERGNQLEVEFNQITSQETGYEQLDQRLKLTGKKRTRLLCFLDHPGIPIENNLAERDLRPAVIIRKLSGGVKSEKGERSFERHMSIIQTAHKQGLNVFDTIHGLLMGTFDPFLLTRKTLPALSSV